MPANSVGPFVAKMDEWRRTMGLGHNAFARHLGISHGYWHQIRTAEKPLTLSVARRVLRERPEYQYFLAQEVVSDDTPVVAGAGAGEPR